MSAPPVDVQTAEIRGWGMAVGGQSRLVQPRSQAELIAFVQWAAAQKQPFALRGSGCSYGDAACGPWVVDCGAINAILAFDAATGLVRAETGATIAQVWQTAVPHGWWPPVVSGTMAPTLGGAAAMNIHGKNAFVMGPIGEHITALKVVLPTGEVRELLPADELFAAVISGAGALAIILEVQLQLKKLHAARLDVWATTAGNLDELFAFYETHAAKSDYLVGWLDAFAAGSAQGRSLIHAAYYLPDGQERDTATALQVPRQQLPTRLFGLIPKAWMWLLLWPFSNNLGMRLINIARYWSGRWLAADKRYRQSHGAFHFLLDYVPNWKKVYLPGGLIQHQIFVPEEHAKRVFGQVLDLQRRRGIVTWLAVVKRHRADRFLLSHGLDGYSLAQDFAVTASNRDKLWALCHEMDDIVAAAGGKVYFAKDATVRPQTVLQMFGAARLRRFGQFKRQCDPEGLLRSAQFDRAIGPAVQLAERAGAADSD